MKMSNPNTKNEWHQRNVALYEEVKKIQEAQKIIIDRDSGIRGCKEANYRGKVSK